MQELKTSLSGKWNDLVAGFAVAEGQHEPVREFLLDSYGGKDRHYHGLQHVYALLEGVERFKSAFTHPEWVKLAVWFHDVIYNARTKDNEQQSAEVACDMLERLGIPQEVVDFVEILILATDGHAVPEGAPEDTALFLDLDLSVLGAAPDAYAAYSEGVRKEYGWVPDLLYKPGRRKVLRHFAEREQLYFTEIGRENWEEQARKNLAAELEALS